MELNNYDFFSGVFNYYDFKNNGVYCLKRRTFQALIPRLSKYTFFSKVNISSSHQKISEKMTLKELNKAIYEHNYVKATCEAEIFNYFNPSPQMLASLILFCKFCNYQNQLPFRSY